MYDLKDFRKDNNLTQNEAAIYFGVTQSFISQIERGERTIPDTFISKIKADTTKKSRIVEAKRFLNIGSISTTAPLISQYAAAGYLAGFSDPEYIEQQPTYTASKKYSGGNYVAFEIRGDSMNDGFLHSVCNGDVVLGKELRKEYWKCKLHLPRIFIIVHRDSGILCKEIIDHDVDRGIITLHSFNPMNNDFELNLSEIAQLFYIKETTRAH